MDNYYVILDDQGYLFNFVVWDGNVETWHTKKGTVAIPISQIDLTSLPQKPEEIQ